MADKEIISENREDLDDEDDECLDCVPWFGDEDSNQGCWAEDED